MRKGTYTVVECTNDPHPEYPQLKMHYVLQDPGGRKVTGYCRAKHELDSLLRRGNARRAKESAIPGYLNRSSS